MTKPPLIAVCSMLMFVGGATYGLEATTLVPVDFTTLVAESQLIVHARVIDVRGELTVTRRSIESVVTVAVLDRLKGQAGQELAFRVPGGQVGRYRRIVVGVPGFAGGDEVVLFLTGHAPAMTMPVGLSQGVYRVTRRSGTALVLPVAPTDTVAGTGRGDAARKPLPLDGFVRQVRLAMERQS